MTEAPSDNEEEEAEDEQLRKHLEEVEDGCGCAEIWEHLSESRGENRSTDA